ncbi:MAG TPA: DNA polymerase III subunit alpha, partial [Candidatus Hydrogenedentes bacterium]|nr:DNA polymerase III subunit alpha [Candidatus Hydrogenedentota bacterium]
FQLESSGMRDLAKRIGLESLEEICALVALYRPGPMALKDQYIECKHHPERIQYDHPLLEPILRETYGVALYQEQIMQIVQAVAGFSLSQADNLRRAMGKKSSELMAQQRATFVEGAAQRDIDKKTAEQLFDKIQQFAGYGFNKSHSMAYALVAYQTAYLKANYPVEFMTALLTSEMGNLDKVAVYVDECRRMGIEVLPPDVNRSNPRFTVEGDAIRFGLTAVKNVGEGVAQAIVDEREAGGAYKDVYDFCSRMDSRQVNRRLIESLNKAGAFLSTGWNRHEVQESLDSALGEGQIAQRERECGQTSLLDMMGDDETASDFRQKPELPEWPEKEILAFEKETLGLYVSSHPLARYAETLRRFSNASVDDIPRLREGQQVVVGGVLATIKHHTTKSGKHMAFLTLDTLEGSCEVTVFSDVFAQRAGLLIPDAIVMIPARVNFRNDEAGLLADDIIPIEEAESRLTRAVHIRFNTIGLDDTLLEHLMDVLSAKPGPCDVYLHCITPNQDEVTVHATSACRVAPSPGLRANIEDILGEDTVWYSGGNGVD